MRLITFCLLALLAHPIVAETWYVDNSTGQDDYTGVARNKAFATIQRAVDSAQPGDTILVAPGVYHEFVKWNQSGSADAPITLRAESSGCYETVLTGADESIRNQQVSWDLVDSDLGLYRVPFKYRPVRVLADRVDLLAYPNLADLKALRFVEDDYPGVGHGFAWDSDTQSLYIRLYADGRYGSSDPNDHVIAAAPPTPGGRWGQILNRDDHFLISISNDKPAHIVIDGFTFETPGFAGVDASAGEVTVRNSWFFGCRYAVAGAMDGSTPNVIVENCFYTQFPAFTDCAEVIFKEASQQREKSEWWQKIMHWQRKGGFPPGTRGIGSPYAYETGLVSRIGENWTIQRNWLWETFEGFSAGSVTQSKDSRIINNRIERVCDNAVESENHAQNLIVAGNLIIDAFEPFSWQPLNGSPLPGPIYVYDNIVLQTPEATRMWETTGNTGGAVKLGCKDDRNWQNGKMGDLPRDVTTAPGGFWFAHNTILVPQGRLITSLNSPGRRYEGFYLLNNLVATKQVTQESAFEEIESISFLHNAVWFAEETTDRAEVAAGEGGWDSSTLAPLAIAWYALGANVTQSNEQPLDIGLTDRKLSAPGAVATTVPGEIPLRRTVGAQAFTGPVGPEGAPEPESILSTIIVP